MRASARHLVLVGILVAALSGCVSVPTHGPVEKVEGQQNSCQNCVNIEVDPPSSGEEPQQIVEGYLRATSNYQPNYSVAKQYLTKAAAQKWSPEDGVSIYSGSPVATGATVILDALLTGTLAPDRTYTARGTKLRWNFGLVKENEEWRISTPPQGLMVEKYSFTSFYQPYNLYFIGNGSALVPDPIYLPSLRTQASIASVLMKALLAGPSVWLKPVVSSALPPTTALSVDSVTVNNGIAEVPLSDNVLQLNDQRRSLMAAQVVYTLKQATGVKGVLFTVNQQPLRVPGGNEADFSVTVDSIPRDLEPIPFVAGEQLYAVRDKRVEVVNNNPDANDSRAMPGALGEGRESVNSLAVSVANTDLAAVTDQRTTLRRTATSGGDLKSLVNDASGLLRPQFTRFGELWTIGRQHGRQRLWVFAGDKEQAVEAPVLDRAAITAFKISPDGTRIALVRRVGNKSVLGLARISRADKVTVDGWRALDTTQETSPALTRIQDVSWIDATDLLLLGASREDAVLSPYRISEDASRISSDTEPANWDAVELTVLLRTQTVIVVGRSGQTWKDDGNQWQPFVDKVKTIAYPG